MRFSHAISLHFKNLNNFNRIIVDLCNVVDTFVVAFEKEPTLFNENETWKRNQLISILILGKRHKVNRMKNVSDFKTRNKFSNLYTLKVLKLSWFMILKLACRPFLINLGRPSRHWDAVSNFLLLWVTLIIQRRPVTY